MGNITRIMIGVQARSTSQRLPNKVNAMIGNKTVLDHVLDACHYTADNNNRYNQREPTQAQVVLLIPKGDPIRAMYRNETIVEGPEHDVLTRYVIAADQFNADYIIRVTGDCPKIPDFVIHKHLNTAHKNRYDYLSNVDPRCRTAPDGFDCEVFSRRMLQYADQQATEDSDREHVTTFMRSCPPDWAKTGFVINVGLDLSHLKVSVDTEEDLNRVRDIQSQLDEKMSIASDIFGNHVHEFS